MTRDWPRWRLHLARTLAWALLLAGWVGLGSLSLVLTPSHTVAFALVALWLLALGGIAELLRRWPQPRWALRCLLLMAGASAAGAMVGALHGHGWGVLSMAWLAWAGVVALASAVVRSCRQACSQAAGPPVAAAAAGALLVWWWVGDLADLPTLLPRLAAGLAGAACLLGMIWPRQGVPGGPCRAGLFDCSLPTWSLAQWRQPQAWPLALAALVMLPTMCSLPLMLALCSSASVSAQTVLGVHFAAMFLPALWGVRRPLELLRVAPTACAALLAGGAALLLLAPGAVGWWAIAVAHGMAWSLAWAAQLNLRGPQAAAHTPVLFSAALNAGLVLALGWGLDSTGLLALSAWHAALGLAGALAWVLVRVLGRAKPAVMAQP